MNDNHVDVRGSSNRVDLSENSGLRVSGKGNKVSVSTRETYITNHRTEVKNQVTSTNSGNSGEGMAVLGGAFMVTIVVAWLYLKNFDSIVYRLHDAILLSTIPIVGALGVFYKRVKDEQAQMGQVVPLFFGPLVALLFIWILNLTVEQLPPRLIGVASTQGVENFWFALVPAERQVLLENITSVACIGLGTVVNALTNVHTFADELLDVTESPIAERLYAATFNFRMARSVIIQLLLAVLATLSITGEGVELFRQLQAYLQGLVS